MHEPTVKCNGRDKVNSRSLPFLIYYVLPHSCNMADLIAIVPAACSDCFPPYKTNSIFTCGIPSSRNSSEVTRKPSRA